MARRATTQRGKEQPPLPQYRCKDCTHSYDWNSPALDGHLILCRCELDEKSKYGAFCKFLSDKQCEYFRKRQI